MTADDRLALAKAMGYAAVIDDTGGYGSRRVVIANGNRTTVFLPETEHLPQVMAWLLCQADVHANAECVATDRGIYSYAPGSPSGVAKAYVKAAIGCISKETK